MAESDDPKPIDWSLTTWEGARREQLRRWSELTLEEILRAQEEMRELTERLTDMRMKRIDSSAIAAVGYEARTLRLEYTNGRTYDYLDVPPQIHQELLNAESAGEFVNREIKPNYVCHEVG